MDYHFKQPGSFNKWVRSVDNSDIEYEIEVYWDHVVASYLTFYDTARSRYSFPEILGKESREPLISWFGMDILKEVEYLISRIKHPIWKGESASSQFSLEITAERYVLGRIFHEGTELMINQKSRDFVEEKSTLTVLQEVTSPKEFDEIIQLAHISYYFHSYD